MILYPKIVVHMSLFYLFTNFSKIASRKYSKVWIKSTSLYHLIIPFLIIFCTKQDVISQCSILYPGLLSYVRYWTLSIMIIILIKKAIIKRIINCWKVQTLQRVEKRQRKTIRKHSIYILAKNRTSEDKNFSYYNFLWLIFDFLPHPLPLACVKCCYCNYPL